MSWIVYSVKLINCKYIFKNKYKNKKYEKSIFCKFPIYIKLLSVLKIFMSEFSVLLLDKWEDYILCWFIHSLN